MSARTLQITDEVALELEAAEVDGQAVRLVRQSADRGAIAKHIANNFDCAVICCELDPARFKSIESFESYNQDFLTLDPADFFDFSRVLMNPPFSRQQDLAHVRHAYQFLKPGGRLVSVMSTSWQFRQNRKSVEFREWLDELRFDWELLPEKSFKASGTLISTGLLTIYR